MAPSLRRAPAVARAPRRAGALPSVSPAAAPALRGLKVSPQRERGREGERCARTSELFLFCVLMHQQVAACSAPRANGKLMRSLSSDGRCIVVDAALPENGQGQDARPSARERLPQAPFVSEPSPPSPWRRKRSPSSSTESDGALDGGKKKALGSKAEAGPSAFAPSVCRARRCDIIDALVDAEARLGAGLPACEAVAV